MTAPNPTRKEKKFSRTDIAPRDAHLQQASQRAAELRRGGVMLSRAEVEALAHAFAVLSRIAARTGQRVHR